MRPAERGRRRSISCAPRDWERITILAARSGRSVSGYVLDCALSADPGGAHAPSPRLVLDAAAQRRLLEMVEGIAACTIGDGGDPNAPDASLAAMRRGLAFLADRQMAEMVDAGRALELRRTLADLFGAGEAQEMIERFAARHRAQGFRREADLSWLRGKFPLSL